MVEQMTLPNLYPHQESMRDEVRTALGKHQRVILCAPPGTGKTRLAKNILGSFSNRTKKDGESGFALFAVHRRGLVDNASDSFNEHPQLRHGVIMSGRETSGGCDIQVASIDTKISWYCEGGQYDTDLTYDLIVMDEIHAHVQKFRTFLMAHDAKRDALGLKPAFVLGLSATPQHKELNKIFNVIVKGPSPQWLIDNGYLSPFRYFQCTQGQLQKLVKRGDEYTPNSVSDAMSGLAGDLVKDWKRLAEGRATVGFFPRRSHAQEAMGLLRANGVDAHYVDGETPDDERKQLFKRLSSGEINYLCNVGVIERGTDIPRIGCVQMCTAVGSVVRWRQMIGRGSRVHPDVKDCCLARGTMVLTERGEVPIESVKISDKIWDGVEFTHHGGARCMGRRNTVGWSGLTVTPDHKVLTNDGWKEAEEAKVGGWQPVIGGIAGKPIRTIDDSNPYYPKKRRKEVSSVRGGRLFGVWTAELDKLLQPDKADQKTGLHAVHSKVWSALPRVGVEARATSASAVSVPTKRVLSSLRWSWDQVSFRLNLRRCLLGCGEPWFAAKQIVDTRPNRQRRKLRTRQLALGNYANAITKPKLCLASETATSLSLCKVQRPAIELPEGKGVDSKADCRQVDVEVWDILDAGPRNRFVANGVVVANCVLDHADGIRKHGFFEDDIQWTLEWGERPSKTHEARPSVNCPRCGAVYRGGLCRACGYEPTPSERKAQGLTFVGGELREVKERPRSDKALKDNESLMISALYIAGKRNMTFGQAWYIAKSMAEKQGTVFQVPASFVVAGSRYSTIPHGHPDSRRKVRDTYGFTCQAYGREDNPYLTGRE